MNLLPLDWPDPPPLAYFTVENPWPMVVVLLAVTVAMWLTAGRSGRHGLLIPAALAALTAGVLPIAAEQVVTDRERIAEGTRTLALAARHPVEMDRILSLTTDDARLLHHQRAQLVEQVRRVRDKLRIESLTITNLLALADSAEYGRSYLAVLGRLSDDRGFGGPFKVQALLRWRREPDGVWRLSHVESMTINEISAERLIPR